MTILIVLIIIAVIVLAVVSIYNKLVRLRNTVKSSWSDIDVQCKKRYDLVPNLVETVKGYAAHEKSVFENVTKARSMAMQATTPAEMAKAENMFRDTLKKPLCRGRGLPELKPIRTFCSFNLSFRSWKTISSRQEGTTMPWSGTITFRPKRFPSNLIASSFNFKREELFQLEAPEAERKAPKVSFS